jgi:hypothetical protein
MLTWLGFGAFFVASATVGVRLVVLGSRDREIPELLIGIGVLGIGPVGFGSMTLGQLVAVDHDAIGRLIYACGLVAVAVGAVSKFAFNTIVYHRSSRVAQGLCVLAGVTLASCFVANGIANGFRNVNQMDVYYVVRTLPTIGCLLWGSAEAMRYWIMMRRRARLGLAEPVVTNRFLLWGVGAGAAGIGTCVGLIAQWHTGLAPIEMPWVMLSSSLHGMVAAVAMWLAFLPPVRYRRWVLERAGLTSAA